MSEKAKHRPPRYAKDSLRHGYRRATSLVEGGYQVNAVVSLFHPVRYTSLLSTAKRDSTKSSGFFRADVVEWVANDDHRPKAEEDYVC